MVEYTPKPAKNGGRKVTISGQGGSVTVNVLSGYSPSWKREKKTTNGSTSSFVTWDGREVGTSAKEINFVRFSLTFSTYGMTPKEAESLKSVIIGSSVLSLSCNEFSGNVTADDFTINLMNSNFYGDFSSSQITLTAVEPTELEEPDSRL